MADGGAAIEACFLGVGRSLTNRAWRERPADIATVRTLAQRHGLRTDRGTADIGVEMEAGIDLAGRAPHGARDVVAVLEIAPLDQAPGGIDQGLVVRRDRRAGKWLVHEADAAVPGDSASSRR